MKRKEKAIPSAVADPTAVCLQTAGCAIGALSLSCSWLGDCYIHRKGEQDEEEEEGGEEREEVGELR